MPVYGRCPLSGTLYDTGTSSSLETKSWSFISAHCKLILDFCPTAQKQSHLFNTRWDTRDVPAERIALSITLSFRARKYFSSHNGPDRLWEPPGSCSTGTGGPLLGARRLGCKADHRYLSRVEGKNVWCYTTLHPYALAPCTGTNLHLRSQVS